MVTGKSRTVRKGFQVLAGSSVVGTSTATCLPSVTAFMAARIATSVLPYPTSPEEQPVHNARGFHIFFDLLDTPGAVLPSPRIKSESSN